MAVDPSLRYNPAFFDGRPFWRFAGFSARAIMAIRRR
jgi:hypothetical protein